MNAVDLEHEVGTWNQRSRKQFCMGERRLFRGHVRFNELVELFVGHEDNLDMQSWPLALEVPHPKANIFTPFAPLSTTDDSDCVSLLAAHAHPQTDFPVHPHQDGAIADNPEVVMDENQFDEHQYESESESESLPSEQLQIYAPGRCFTTVIYALDGAPTTLRLDWNDHEGFHHSIAMQLGVPPSDLYHVHYVATRPQDLARANVEVVIAHREGDLQVGSLQRLTLLDVEFHASNPLTDPEVARKVFKIMDKVNRQQLIRLLGLEAYCAEARQRCLLWINNDLIPLHTKILHIEDGDYIRIALPPGDARMDHVATRCLASAFYQGLSVPEILDRHTLHLLGFYDTVIGPPHVPVEHDQDAHGLLQLFVKMVPPLDDTPLCLRHTSIHGHDIPHPICAKLEDEIQPPELTRSHDDFPQEQARIVVDMQPAFIHELRELWTQHAIENAMIMNQPYVSIRGIWTIQDTPPVGRAEVFDLEEISPHGYVQ